MDEYFMNMAIDLARKGEGRVSPNPLVGAVIVKNNKVISTGYHKLYGMEHAEINAINNAKEPLEGATIYVTLEPCSHYGKTPPCALTLIEKKFKRVVIGMKDVNPIVSGNGIDMLLKNNIEVKVGVLEKECKELNEVFINYIKTLKPFVLLKYAMTLDGKIATFTKDSKYITSEKSRKEVHKLRNKYKAIMVGINTILNDNPLLNCRIEGGVNPIPIIVDSNLRIPMDLNIFNVHEKIIVATISDDEDKINKLKSKGVEIIKTSNIDNQVNLSELMIKLKEKEIDSILLEGGSTLNYSMVKSNLVNKVMSFISPKILGGKTSPTPLGGRGIEFVRDAIKLKNINQYIIDEDIVIEGYL
ncbi:MULTISPECIES: bifunctional diaminohydroxyphosphoribosylaminopyrimidine deaminase/5-amino-6-(5-phosphoribosylamino)uracil reductase RibD [unclassified Romboutsia]|uniref:bifunctional diaminohydroxyphosphoribosylaminopyrimidine deaminase/5-amino-6-(5-phosphoribosylamino)uracil reductase RibD n=1 Tax=unclassified Romboutsia TaxID=2626894 RepID=UPI0008227347|nr:MULTISPECIES: bifunctional diaminohydroxyphosphoribosylaminopyrimidine deaminase/5-amino-6-(5-phosphoribosylamino)uracil reductase RibD [unclassified Romboutsia]SCI41025.1 Riboflavin biosynthesis protein RibD [uncultured Clostridium sp.]